MNSNNSHHPVDADALDRVPLLNCRDIMFFTLDVFPRKNESVKG